MKFDPKALSQLGSVLLLEFDLRWGECRSDWIVDEIEAEFGSRLAVAEATELAKRLNALLENTAPSLLIDILVGVAGERRDDLHSIFGEKFGGILLAGLE
jgi:hypothetical protein